ncbi:hypothetical protein PV327_004149 [Microctonus hyperodae]|uniref:Uncharacterized protein n=1 Tax=Microctonus hyperodae TaxID=165561 RepID=A0AA39FBT0_MICHY|nr:hypothetical protein PV327_004149 [Microctonus hyperodae]
MISMQQEEMTSRAFTMSSFYNEVVFVHRVSIKLYVFIPQELEHDWIKYLKNRPEKAALRKRDFHVHPPSRIGPDSSEASGKTYKRKQQNPYASFFSKPRRKAIIWRPLTAQDLEGYDSEATLRNHATKITDEICSEFYQWLRSLGGFNTTLDEEVLKNMFETDFTADACKTIQISMKEMPTVPTVIADARNCPDAGEVESTWKQLRQDLKAEKNVSSLVGFGTTVPQNLKFVPPRNYIENHWLQCKYVPNDLETNNTIWKDITHLDSVKGFTEWLKPYSNVKQSVGFQNS